MRRHKTLSQDMKQNQASSFLINKTLNSLYVHQAEVNIVAYQLPSNTGLWNSVLTVKDTIY